MEYDWVAKSILRPVMIIEEMYKWFPDSIITIAFGATIQRFSEDKVGGTFMAFLHSLSSLANNWPQTLVLFLNDALPIYVVLFGAIAFEVVYYNTVVQKMEKY